MYSTKSKCKQTTQQKKNKKTGSKWDKHRNMLGYVSCRQIVWIKQLITYLHLISIESIDFSVRLELKNINLTVKLSIRFVFKLLN